MAGSDSGASHTDDITNVTTPVFTGTAVGGSTVDLFDGTTLVGQGVAGGAGVWSIKSNPLASGAHSITAEDITASGTSTASGTLTVTIDTTPPLAPSTPAFSAPHTGNATTYNALTFTGTAEAGSTVTLFDGSTTIGSATAGVGGGWTITPGTLAVGVHSISADAMDIAGNIGLHSVPLALTIQATNNVHWVAGSDDFANAADWEPQRVPGATDNAIIDAAGAYTVTATSSEAMKTLAMVAGAKLVVSAGTFAVSGGSGAGGLAGSVSITDGAALALAGAVVNSGTIAENAAASTTEILLTGAVTLSGHGSVILSNSANNVVFATAATTLLTNLDNSIAGAGTIGLGQMALTNGGVINANRTTALTLDTGANTIINTGTLEATAAGGLVLNSAVDQSGGGTISAAGSGVVVSFDAAILGGRLATSGGAVIRTNGSAAALDGQGLHPLTNAGAMQVADGTALTLLGSIINSGTITAASTGDATTLLIGSPVVTVSGHGRIVLGGAGASQIVATTANFSLDNVDNAISGAGLISARLTNSATVSADQATTLTINGAVTNAGTLQATGAGGLVLQGIVVGNAGGTVQAVGAGAHVDLSTATIAGGTLHTALGGVIDTVNGGTIDGLSLGAVSTDAAISVKDNEGLAVLGTIANGGMISLLAAVGSSQLRLVSATVTLTGGGRNALSNNANNSIVGSAAGQQLVNVNNIIAGAGQIGAGQMRLTNQAGGVINANQKAAGANPGALMLNTGAAPIINLGLLEATNTGGLVVQSAVMNAGGRLLAAGAGAHVDLAGVTIVGGTLTSSGGGVFNVVQPSTTLDGLSAGTLANAGSVVVQDNANLTLLGTINNTGAIKAAAVAGAASIVVGGPATTLTGKGSLLLSNNAGNAVVGTNSLSQLVNSNNTIAGAGQLGAGGALSLANAAGAVIDANQAVALVLNATGNVSNAGLIEATDTVAGNGGFVVQSTAIHNAGGTVAANGAHSHVDLAGGIIIGGTLATSGGGAIDVTQPSTTLDGLSAGTLANAGSVVVVDNAALTLLGTINNTGTITAAAVASTAAIIIGGPATTLMGKGSLLLGNNAGNQVAGVNAFSQLVNVNNTIAGAGLLGNGSPLSLVNTAGGIVNANQAVALVLNMTGDVSNAGLMEATGAAVGNGGFVVQNSTIDNAGGTVAANGVHAHFDLAAGTIMGGALATSGGGVIQTAAGASGVLDGLDDGALTNNGLVRVTDSTALELLSSIVNKGTINLNATTAGNTDLQIGSPVVTLTGGGTVLLSNKVGNRIGGLAAANQLVNVNNTIAGAGQLGAGVLAFSNGGTVNANASVGLTIDLGGQAGQNLAGGLIEATAAGGLSIATGLIGNAGTMLAANGGKLTFQPGAVNAANAGGVLVGGTWEASGNLSTLLVTGGAVTTDAATIILSGAGSAFRAGDGTTFTNLEASLGSIAPAGVLDVLAGRSYTSGKGVTDNGVVQLGGGTLSLGALNIGAGAHLIGFGTVATGSKTIAAAGTIEAGGGTLSTASVINGAGALRADTGATVTLTGAGSAIASVVNDSTLTLGASAGLDVTNAVDAASSGIFQLNASSLLELAADQGAGDKMNFLGTGELIVDAAAKFGLNVGGSSYTGPLIQHFVAGDQILLKDLAPVGLTPLYNATTGLLQISNGSANVASLAFDKTTLGAGSFHIANSGGHALLTHS